jgi:hypothetical protein
MFKSKQKQFNSLILPMSQFEQYRHEITKMQHSNFGANNFFNTLNQKMLQFEQYFKLNCRSAHYILENILVREKEELRAQIVAESDQPEVCFVEEALSLLSERESQILSEIGKSGKEQKSSSKSIPLDIQSTNTNPTEITDEENFSFFYQSTDGQRIYTNSLNTRCLINEYQTFQKCPQLIQGTIVACQSFFLSEENRKRFKYLSHLPLHSEFKIVEVEFDNKVLSQQTKDMFSREINERKQMRERKIEKDKRVSERATAALNLQDNQCYYVASSMNEETNILDYSHNFPESALVLPSENSLPKPQQQPQQQSSFAQALKEKTSSLQSSSKRDGSVLSSSSNISAWPSLESASSSLASGGGGGGGDSLMLNANSQLTNNWLTNQFSQQRQHQEQEVTRSKRYQDAPKSINSDDDKEESSMPAPLYRESFFSAIDESLALIESKKALNALEDDSCIQQKEKPKKKKKTKVLLFSTA